MTLFRTTSVDDVLTTFALVLYVRDDVSVAAAVATKITGEVMALVPLPLILELPNVAPFTVRGLLLASVM